jgi:zinc D-Ala-D-Ala dipeptidase
MLSDAQDDLMQAHPDLRLHVYDCARPASVQWRMWGKVKGTPSQKYVGNPAHGSIHSYGCAVDLTVADKDGNAIDMGTPYDFFGPKAHPALEKKLFEKGELTSAQLANRHILREVMLRAGFHMLQHEWWHFDCASQSESRTRYQLIP